MKLTPWAGLAFAAALSLTGALYAESGSDSAELTARLKQLEAKVQAQQATINQLTAAKDDTWLNERRTEEVKALVKEVLADADTRASLMGDGMTAGYDGKFFVASPNGDFRLNFTGQAQARYVANFRRSLNNSATGTDDGHETGFQISRVEPTFDGFIGDPKLEFVITLKADRDLGLVSAKIVQIAYTVPEANLKIFAGRINDRFSRESLMSSKNQQTADRSAVDNVFAKNDDIVEGVGLEWKALPEYLILAATYNDGLNSGTTGAIPTSGIGGTGGHDFQNGAADLAVSARADLKLAGDWAQTADVESWSAASDFQAFLAAGFHYESSKTGDKQTAGKFALTGPSAEVIRYDELYMWTADALVKCHGFGFMGSFYGLHLGDAAVGLGAAPAVFTPVNLNNYGATAQAGYLIQDTFEPFVRYEWINPDSRLRTNQLNLATVGFNWFLRRHAAKFTVDTVIAFNNVNNANTLNTSLTGIGLLPDDPFKKGQVVVRVQFQLLF